MTNITRRELVGEALKKQPLMLASKLVCSMNFDVAFRAQRRLIGAADHRRRRLLTHITLNLHLLHSKIKSLDHPFSQYELPRKSHMLKSHKVVSFSRIQEKLRHTTRYVMRERQNRQTRNNEGFWSKVLLSKNKYLMKQ